MSGRAIGVSSQRWSESPSPTSARVNISPVTKAPVIINCCSKRSIIAFHSSILRITSLLPAGVRRRTSAMKAGRQAAFKSVACQSIHCSTSARAKASKPATSRADWPSLPDSGRWCCSPRLRPHLSPVRVQDHIGIKGKKCNVGRGAVGSPFILVNEVELCLSSRPKHFADINRCGSAQDFDHGIS